MQKRKFEGITVAEGSLFKLSFIISIFEAMNAHQYFAATSQSSSQCVPLNMLSATMQYYYPAAGPASATGYPKVPCRSAMPYCSSVEPLPSPTPLQGMSSLYMTRPYLQPSLTPSSKPAQSNETAAVALVALQDPSGVPASVASPVGCKPLSPEVKLEKGSPISSMTPPPPGNPNEPDSSTGISNSTCNSTNPDYSSGVALTPDQASTSPDFSVGIQSYADTASLPGPVIHLEAAMPYGVTNAQSGPSLRPAALPYSHSPTYLQPAAIRYPSNHTGTIHVPNLPYGYPPLQRTGETFQRPNSCHICGKTYARQSTLKTHLRSHSGEKPYQCSICQKSFTQAANLTAHLRTHSGEKPFKCPVCNRGFSQSSSVTTHMRTHSGDRPYKCSACGKGFADSSTLTKHYRTHTGEKPYQCKICDARFSQSGNLNRHMRTHRNHFQGGATLLSHPV